MKLKKLDEEVIESRRSEEITFSVNGKKVRAWRWYEDSLVGGYDNDYGFNEEDLEKLTEEEREIIDENEMELFDLKVGEQLKLEE